WGHPRRKAFVSELVASISSNNPATDASRGYVECVAFQDRTGSGSTKAVVCAVRMDGGFRVMGLVRKKNFFLAKKTFSLDSARAAGFNEAIRVNDGIGFIRIFDAHDVVQPGLLAHRVYVHFLAMKLVHQCQRAVIVRAG